MEARPNAKEISPSGFKAMGALHAYVHHCGLETSLLELVKLGVSQINGCAHRKRTTNLSTECLVGSTQYTIWERAAFAMG
jgi:hypothetical protein